VRLRAATSHRLIAGLAFLALGCAGVYSVNRSRPELRWWKGNTHTHTLWSDGDGAPEWVVDWYREHDYDFLALSDHNVWLEDERWFPISEPGAGRLTQERVEGLRARFGADSVQVELRDGQPHMRLITLGELRQRFEVPGEFLLVGGEEITDQAGNKPVHVNGFNLEELVEPPGGATPYETANAIFAQVEAQGRRLGRPVLAHLNHPNFGWAFSLEDLVALEGERFFEVYNGHPAVHNDGDAQRPGTEALWDMANLRRVELGRPLLFGIGSDDSHHYHAQGAGQSNSGRAWIQVHAAALEADSLVAALRAGDFYASSGVTLSDVSFDGTTLTVDIATEPDQSYRTEFIGVTGAGRAPAVLLETSADPAVYTFTGGELFVRSRVTSSRPHPNPSSPGDAERAWTQPVQPR